MAMLRTLKVSILLFCALSQHLNKANGRCLRKAAKETCPAGWSKWNSHCYKFISEHREWANAKDKCIEIGGVMATPNSLEEQSHLQSVTLAIWIDCNDIEEEGTWECKDGATDVDFRSWGDGEPNSGIAYNCGTLWPSGWRDWQCGNGDKAPVVCKQPVA
ncbi:perlucin-like protein [Asterias rubens]|uniref:perlucin-like protein n=1 Tax=Asterias rubens TaxID=7604 RepID=UPI0014557254|nr:perlucin-like protein [Asterias rubens]